MVMRWLRRLHRWVGLALMLPMLVLGATGVLLTLEPVWPERAARPEGAGGVARAEGEILAAAVALAPAGARAVRYTPPGAPGEAASAQFAGRAGGALVRIDPVSLAPLGPVEAPGGFMRWVHALHANFLLAEFGGRSIVDWCGVGLVFLTAVGIPLWWPAPGQMRAAFSVSFAAKGVRFHRRLHGAVGIWIAAVLSVNALTGAMLGFPQTLRGAFGLAPPGGPPRAGATGPAPRTDLTAVMALARAAVPGLAPRFAMLPAGPGEPVRVFLGTQGGGAAGSGMAVVDVAGTRLISVQDPRGYGPGEMAWRWGRDLHAGAGLGPVWRALTVAAGLALPVFSVTGLAMWLLRRRNRLRVRSARGAAAAD
jgi:uncharacterized iron-regulated membrane protein